MYGQAAPHDALSLNRRPDKVRPTPYVTTIEGPAAPRLRHAVACSA